MRERLEMLGIEYKECLKYYTKCPKCDSESSTALSVRRENNIVSYRCMRIGQCDWNKTRTINLNPSPNEPDNAIVYDYCDTQGNILFQSVRVDNPDGTKLIRQRIPMKDGSYKREGYKGKALYGAELLAGCDKVLVVEGEKTANAARWLFPEFVVITWPNGCGGIHKGDWGLLANKEVVLWPDADDVGIKAMKEIGELIQSENVWMVDPVGLEKSVDLADDIPQETIDALFASRRKVRKTIIPGSISFSEFMESLNKDVFDGIPYGFDELDQETSIPKDGIVLVSGRTNHGKTLFFTNVVANLLTNSDKNIIYYTFERPAPEILMRTVMAFEGKSFSDSSKANLKEYYRRCKLGELECVDQYIMNALQSRLFVTPLGDSNSIITHLNNSKLADSSVCIIDYGQIIRMSGDDRTRYRALKEVVERLNDVAMKQNMGILVGSQLSVGEGSSLADQAREGRDLEFTARVHLKIWNKTVATARGATEKAYNEVPGDIIIHVQKNMGQVGMMYGFDLQGGSKLVPVKSFKDDF